MGVAPSMTRGQNFTVSITSNLKPAILNEFRSNTLYGIITLAPYLQGKDFNKEAKIKGTEETKRSFDIGSFPDFSSQKRQLTDRQKSNSHNQRELRGNRLSPEW